MKKILFVNPTPTMSTFVAQDRDILARHFEVTILPWRKAGDALGLGREIHRHDAAFSWFVSHHSAATALLGRAAGRPSVVVAAGEDVSPPEVFAQSWRRRDFWAARIAVSQSDLVLAISRTPFEEARWLRGRRARSEMRLVHCGIDTHWFSPAGPRDRLVLSVAVIFRDSAARKRLALLVRAASLLPEVRFVIAGAQLDGTARQLMETAPANVEFPGEPSPDGLRDLYRRAAVYVQASRHEGFGVANAEAMASGCVPVVTREGALPEVVGDAGVYVETPTPEGLAEAIRRGLASDLGKRARQRIIDHFSLERREAALVLAMEDALSGRLIRGRYEPPPPVPGTARPAAGSTPAS